MELFHQQKQLTGVWDISIDRKLQCWQLEVVMRIPRLTCTPSKTHTCIFEGVEGLWFFSSTHGDEHVHNPLTWSSTGSLKI